MKTSQPPKAAASAVRTVFFSLFNFLLFAGVAHAQWQTTNYTLKGGWNSIYLPGDATYAAPEVIFPDSGVTANIQEIWRWNPNPSQMQFTSSPLVPASGTPEWSVWVRGGTANTLGSLTGQAAYLVKCVGTTANTYSGISVKHSPRLPDTSWVRNGANFLGFPTRLNGTYPLFSSYFASFPAAIAANAKIFKYVGGDLGPANPVQVFSPSTERVDANQGYWFSAEVVGNFYAPVEVTLSQADGMDFGRNGSVITMRVMNRTASAMTLTITPVASGTAPDGGESLSASLNNVGLPTGSVPVTRRTFNSGTASWQETLISAGYTEAIGPGAAVELSFGIQRSAMTAASPSALYASFLRLTDSTNLFDLLVPVRARKTSLSGLWIGEALVQAVESKPAADAVTPTGRAYPLRYILHVADDGTARVLSQVFVGKLASPGNPPGLCTKEAGLLSTEKAGARRLVAAHMPLDRVLDTGTGSVAVPGSLARTISLPFNDPTNPFVHAFHPDHDNKGATGAPLVAGQEAYTITRNVTFTFTAAPPSGSSVTSGWGSSVIGGTYAEVIQGLHKDSTGVGTGNGLNLSGTFELRRVSELGNLSITP
ncbi:MAG: hypothetical protein IAE77_30420 [Prosthecobacter sp.]|jgi:hypothetical protein|uniref:hypothetical protein n=1 Tax=Prosthecobacter sp. TaxID=1965333 RepID=UPI0019F1C9F8|nr:hypothetical protein [Prosthecobacter sp.]MBE2287812.1 hypothetical protein [Prosthecobacter sp.]